MENLTTFECPYFPMEDLPRIKELWKEKLESLHIDTNEVDMDYLATNFNDDFAVYCNFDEKTILSFDFEQPDDEIERLIRRRYLKSDPFLAKFPQKPGGKCKYDEPELELMRVDRAALIEELALNGIEICEDPENYIDRGDYIELVKPAGRIKMIEKIGSRNPLQKKKAYEYARNLNLGGLTGWKLPGIRELLAIYVIKDICGIKKYKSSFYDFWWSASETDGCGYLWSLAFSNGIIKCEYYKYTHNYYARCIRYAE